MSSVALRTLDLGKMYRIGGHRERYPTLRDALVRVARRPIERIRRPGAASHRSEILWALRHVDLEVNQGETLGIIGKNGAGKSTLLKILSRITEPTEGRVEIQGRVGSLLEVGTGFHPELSGRENIMLNGAILGMSRAEIKRRFDAIVEFSEISRFLETPIKRYSSGMYVRLAFAVAAHLDPEILVVDEVLAVGDAEFQKKCLGKMGDVAEGGRTVLFVSHNMQAVKSLCSSAIELEQGRIANAGEAASVVGAYLMRLAETEASIEWAPGEGPGDSLARMTALRVVDSSGDAAPVVRSSEPVWVRIEFDLKSVEKWFGVGFALVSSDGSVALTSFHTDIEPASWPHLVEGRNVLECEIPAGLLNAGRYYVLPRMAIHYSRWIAREDVGVSFEAHKDHAVSPCGEYAHSGVIAPTLRWRAGDR